ncbi:TVP38/TMEM64 family protein [Cryptosporangium minutisporangium]|uniref:TVP38/TMEM64 family membrane protein n=1 Tax=Cryptosporangium minutisporangium TaxID=113569 RepID=A0ABP6T0W6_9ACTN
MLRLRVAALVGVLLVGAVTLWLSGPPEAAELRAAVADTGVWTPVAVVIVAVLAALVLVPRAVPAVLAGLLLPPALGVLCALAGSVAGATLAFSLGRALGRPYLLYREQRAGPAARLARLQRWLDRHGLAAVIYARLAPVLPFGLLNYAFGATTVRLAVFVAGTTVGIAPSTAAYVYLGAAADDPASVGFLLPLGVVTVGALVASVHARWAHRTGRSQAADVSPDPPSGEKRSAD